MMQVHKSVLLKASLEHFLMSYTVPDKTDCI